MCYHSHNVVSSIDHRSIQDDRWLYAKISHGFVSLLKYKALKTLIKCIYFVWSFGRNNLFKVRQKEKIGMFIVLNNFAPQVDCG